MTWALLLYFMLALLVMGPHVVPLTEVSRLSYDADDASLFLWNFWWLREALFAGENPYFCERVLHPTGGSLAFTSFALPQGLLSIPFQLYRPGIEGLTVALNTMVLLSFTLSGAAAYRLALHVTKRRDASLMAGVVFGFSLFHMMNTARVHLLTIELVPFAVLALLRLGEHPCARRAAVFAGWLALTFYTSLEYALYIVLFSVLWWAYRVVSVRSVEISVLRALGFATAVFAVLSAPLLVQQVSQLERATSKYDLAETIRWSPALASFFMPSRVHPLWGDAMRFAGEYDDGSDKVGMRSETSLGLAALALAALGAASRRRERRFWTLTAGLFLILCLGPVLRVTGTWLTEWPLPYRILWEALPVIRAGRDPTRLLVVASLGLAVLAAFGTGDLLDRCESGRTRVVLLGVLCGVVLFERLPGEAPKYTPSALPIHHEIGLETGDFAVVDHSGAYGSLLGQIVHGRKLTYVSAFPRITPSGKDFPIDMALTSASGFAGAEGVESMVSRLREIVEEQGIRHALLPERHATADREALCRALGARTQRLGPVLHCRFPQDHGPDVE